MPMRLPTRSSHFVIASPFFTIGFFGEVPTPISAVMVFSPWLTAIGTSAGPMEPMSIDPDTSAVRVSA